jgi:hypothetical protein
MLESNIQELCVHVLKRLPIPTSLLRLREGVRSPSILRQEASLQSCGRVPRCGSSISTRGLAGKWEVEMGRENYLNSLIKDWRHSDLLSNIVW